MLPASEGVLTDNTGPTFAKPSLRDEDVVRAELGVYVDTAVRKISYHIAAKLYTPMYLIYNLLLL